MGWRAESVGRGRDARRFLYLDLAGAVIEEALPHLGCDHERSLVGSLAALVAAPAALRGRDGLWGVRARLAGEHD